MERNRMLRRFQEEISELVDQYLLDGLPPDEIELVLEAEASNDLPARLTELRDFIAAAQSSGSETRGEHK